MLASSKDSTPEELHSPLETLGENTDFLRTTKGIKLNFKRVSAQEGGQTSLDGSEDHPLCKQDAGSAGHRKPSGVNEDPRHARRADAV